MSKEKTFRRATYDSCQPLNCCEFKNLNRQLGVTVSLPFKHQGLNRECVEITRETISVNTHTFGTMGIDADSWKAKAIEFTADVISDLDETIKELIEHRDRLTVEFNALHV